MADFMTLTTSGGRVLTVGEHVERRERWDGDRLCEYRVINLAGKQVGKLWRSDTYGKDRQWHVTTRELAWSGDGFPPLGICFDGGPHATAQEALSEFGRIADQCLDWREGKRVQSIYSKTGYYQR